MITTSHTPGPWQASISGQGNGPAYVDDSDGMLIVRPDGWGSLHGSQDETVANARLIAAAPNLLIALWEMLDEVRDVSKGVRLQAREALSKALGCAIEETP